MGCRTLAIAFSIAAIFALGRARAAVINNSTITILPSSTPAYPGYPQSDALDVGPNQYVTDYASNGGGDSTHLDFMFTGPEVFSQIVYTDRTTSGSGNGAFNGGTGDFNTKYEFIFATDPAFTNVVGTVVENETTPSQPTSIASFQEIDPIPDITAQYVRFQVLSTNDSNPGAADFEFSVVPEPRSIAAILGLGAMGLLIAARRKFLQIS